MSILTSILTGIIVLTITFLLYGYTNVLFDKEKRQDFIIKTRKYCKLILEFPFTAKLLILLFIVLLFFPLRPRALNTIMLITAIPLMLIYFFIGDSRNNVIADIIIKCFILFVMCTILAILFSCRSIWWD